MQLPEFPHPDGSSIRLSSPVHMSVRNTGVTASASIASLTPSQAADHIAKTNPAISVYVPSLPGIYCDPCVLSKYQSRENTKTWIPQTRGSSSSMQSTRPRRRSTCSSRSSSMGEGSYRGELTFGLSHQMPPIELFTSPANTMTTEMTKSISERMALRPDTSNFSRRPSTSRLPRTAGSLKSKLSGPKGEIAARRHWSPIARQRSMA